MSKTLSEMSIDELKKKYGAKVKRGEITVSRGKYYFSAGGKKYQLNPSTTISSQPLEKMVRKSTVAGGIFRGGSPIVIILLTSQSIKKFPGILCYVPVPDLRVRIDQAMRKELVTQLVKESKLSPVLGRQIINEIGSPSAR